MKPITTCCFYVPGNSARSIMAEADSELSGEAQFRAYSAGSHPSGTVRPEALRQLELAHIPTAGLRSKAWNEFSQARCAEFGFCFHGLRQRCQGSLSDMARSTHDGTLGRSDPAAVEGSERREACFSRRFLRS